MPPDGASLIRATTSRDSSPRVHSGPRTCRSSVVFRIPRGVRNDWAKRRARGARIAAGSRMPFGTRRPCAFQHTGRSNSSLSRTGHRTQVSPAFRTRMGFSACSMSPGIAALVGTCLVRANCRPDMHLGRPPAWSASTACRLADPRLPPVIRKLQARPRSGHRIPLRVMVTAMTRPLIGTGRQQDIPVRTKVHDRGHAAWTNLWRNLW